jgi:hypothetical protein
MFFERFLVVHVNFVVGWWLIAALEFGEGDVFVFLAV